MVVRALLESDVYGPPPPDAYLGLTGTSEKLSAMHAEASALMARSAIAFQLERQRKKHGVEKSDVDSYIRADVEYPHNYSPKFVRGSLPAGALVGMWLKNGKKVIFDMAVLPKQ